MQELVIVSGKGGTGKTSIAAALAYLAPHKVIADCDVDAANFHLIAGAAEQEAHGFTAGFEPEIDQTRCTNCGVCTRLCRFDAITSGTLSSPLDCEGCGVCAFNCPQHAIAMREKEAGHWFIADTRLGLLVHAKLGLAVENSGKLVSKVRQEAKKLATAHKYPLIITDGPPGIGCPAIAAISGASLVLAVVEPTLPSRHDLKRLASLVKHFQLPLAVCINKSDLHTENTNAIAAWCADAAIPVVGRIPYSDAFRTAVNQGKTVMDTDDTSVKEPLTSMWRNLAAMLGIADRSNTSFFWSRWLSKFKQW